VDGSLPRTIFFDSQRNRVYYGDGNIRQVQPILVRLEANQVALPVLIQPQIQGVSPYVAGTEPDHYLIAEPDGEMVHLFDFRGRHMQSRSA
jgi:hypothetical protein